jgi:Rad3-related DNA helicase
LPCGIANQPKKKIALQNPHLTFQVCAEFPCLCTICRDCTPCFFKDLSQAFMALQYVLLLHTLLFEGFVSSFHGFALSAAAAHLAF